MEDATGDLDVVALEDHLDVAALEDDFLVVFLPVPTFDPSTPVAALDLTILVVDSPLSFSV